eukprot:2166335-Amphidinium_carterae.1
MITREVNQEPDLNATFYKVIQWYVVETISQSTFICDNVVNIHHTTENAINHPRLMQGPARRRHNDSLGGSMDLGCAMNHHRILHGQSRCNATINGQSFHSLQDVTEGGGTTCASFVQAKKDPNA